MTASPNRGPQPRGSWQDAYDTQMAVWRWLRGEGDTWLEEHLNYTVKSLPAERREANERLLSGLYFYEPHKLLSADPFFVSEEMCEVVEAAEASFEPEPLYPTDLLSSHGFMLYEKPFIVPDRFERPMSIAAISWAPLFSDGSGKAMADELMYRKPGDNTIMSYLSAKNEEYQKAFNDEDPTRDKAVDGLAIAIYTTTKFEDSTKALQKLNPPSIVPSHFTPWWFGMPIDGNEVDLDGKPTGAAWWWRLVQTTFRLMQQQLAVRRRERPARGSRREAGRRGFFDRDVVVVRLRRERDTRLQGEPMGEAHYSHRFIVGGHWRNQPYPSEGVHRQIWISPYVKGPEEAPLVVRPRRAFTWSR